MIRYWRQVKSVIQEAIYWLKCHLLPPYRFHLLDLRQPKDSYDPYRYGYRDIDHLMLYACFELLNRYVKQKPSVLDQAWLNDLHACAKFDCDKRWADAYQSIHDLHVWWNKTRQTKCQEIDRLNAEWLATKNNPQLHEQFRITQLNRQTTLAEETQNRLEQLIKIRECLW